MNRLEATLKDMVARLGELQVDMALVGGLAVSARAEPRFTRDVDFAVVADHDEAAEAVVKHLLAAGFQVLATVEQKATRRLATARLLPPGETEEGVVVDLLFASSGIEAEVVRSAETIEVFPGTIVPVATLPHLIALKVLARDDDRPQDDVDLRSLMILATGAHLEEARAALKLVDERGFGRRRDLQAALDTAASRWR